MSERLRYRSLVTRLFEGIREWSTRLTREYEVVYPPLVYLAKKLHRPPHVLLNAIFIVIAIVLVLNPQSVSAVLSDLIIFLPLFLTSLDQLQGIQGAHVLAGNAHATKLRIDLWVIYSALIMFETSIGRESLNDNLSLYWIVKVGLMFWVYLHGTRDPPAPSRKTKKRAPPLVLTVSNFSPLIIPPKNPQTTKAENKQITPEDKESQTEMAGPHNGGLPPLRSPFPPSPEPPHVTHSNALEVAITEDMLESEEEESDNSPTEHFESINHWQSSAPSSADDFQAQIMRELPPTEEDAMTMETPDIHQLKEHYKIPLHIPSEDDFPQQIHPSALSTDFDDADDADIESTNSSPGSAASAFAAIMPSKTLPRSHGPLLQAVNDPHQQPLKNAPQKATQPQAVPTAGKPGISDTTPLETHSMGLEDGQKELEPVTSLSDSVAVPIQHS